MEGKILHQPLCSRGYSQAIAIVNTLQQNGYKGYLTGGCVRDMILGRAPRDYDIATDAHPSQVEALFSRTVMVGAQFGVVKVILSDQQMEVATFRCDGIYQDGRHPESVTFVEERQDALRRDFTVNGLFFDPSANRVIDYVDGQADIKKRIIRTIGKPTERFQEDFLRMMRAIRFSWQLSFKLAPGVEKSITQLAPNISRISWERKRDELFKILNYGRGQGLRHLQNTALLENILPEVTALIGMQQPPQFHPEGDVFTHTCNTLDALDTRVADELLVAAMLHDIGKPATAEKDGDRIRFNQHAKVGAEIAEKICQRFRLAKWQTNLVKQMILQHMRFMDVQKMKLSTLKRFLKQENFSKHLELHRADCLASHKKLANYRFCHQQLTRLKEDEEKQEGEPKPLLNGRDLIAIGFSPGPLFATILREMEDAQLEGVVSTKKQAMDLAVQKFWSFDK